MIDEITQIYREFGAISPIHILEGTIGFCSFTYDRYKLFSELRQLFSIKIAYIASCIDIIDGKYIEPELKNYLEICNDLSKNYPIAIINSLFKKLQKVFEIPDYNKLSSNNDIIESHVFNFPAPSKNYDNFFTRKISAWYNIRQADKNFDRLEKILGTRFKASDVKHMISSEVNDTSGVIKQEPEINIPLSWAIEPQIAKQVKSKLGGYVQQDLEDEFGGDLGDKRKEIFKKSIENVDNMIKKVENEYKGNEDELIKHKQTIWRKMEFINMYNASRADFGAYFRAINDWRGEANILASINAYNNVKHEHQIGIPMDKEVIRKRVGHIKN